MKNQSNSICVHSKLLTISLIAIIAVSSLLTDTTHAAPTQAARADDFVEFLGINIKLNRAIYENNWSSVRSKLNTLNIRYYRDGLKNIDNSTYKSRQQGLYNDYGMKLMGIWSPWEHNGIGPGAAVSRAQQAKEYLLAVAGPNEPDLFWANDWDFGGFTEWFDEARWYQNQLFTAINANSQVSNIPVPTPALAFVENVDLVGPCNHDIVAWHYYSGSYDVIGLVDKRNAARNDFNSTKPTYLTETGFNTHIPDFVGVNEKTQMKYVPRVLMESFIQGDQKVFLHQLMDEGTTANVNNRWGMVRPNFTNKPSFNALRNLIDLFNESSWNASSKTWNRPSYTPSSLDYSLSGNLSLVRQKLFQRSNGQFYLVAWIEKNSWNQGTNTPFSDTSRSITLNLSAPAAVEQYRFNDSGNWITSNLGSAVTSRSITIEDRIRIFKIVPQGSAPPTGVWYKIRNLSHGGNRNLTALSSSNSWNVTTSTNTGWWTDWKLVNASSNYYYIRNRGHNGNRNLRASGSGASWNVNSSANTLEWEQWRLIDVGGGYYNLRNKGHGGVRNLRAGDSPNEQWNVNTTTSSLGWEKWRFVQ
ncbi:MAG: RICIN domain-containing protein [Verrucomicrobiota bacterium]